jgi:hypothetical protein
MARARTLSVVGIATALAVPLLGGTASADPSGGDRFTLTCGGTTYQAVSNGNGQFTAAHDLNSTKTFVPHAFGPFTGNLYDASGTLVSTETDPAVTQGSGKQKNDLSCTYSFTFVSDGSDPEGPPADWTFTGSGSVTGHATGH